MQLTMNNTMNDVVSILQDKSMQYIAKYCGRSVGQV